MLTDRKSLPNIHPTKEEYICLPNRICCYGLRCNLTNRKSPPEEFWNNLHEGKIGIKPITKFDASEIPVFNAGEIQDFPFDKYFCEKKIKIVWIRTPLYAIYATMEAIENSGLNMEEEDPRSCGVIVSSGIGGLQRIGEPNYRMHERGMKRIQPMFIPKALSNMGCWKHRTKIGAQGYVNPDNCLCFCQ